MKRRQFIKSMGALGVTAIVPSFFTSESFIRRANAAPAVKDVMFTTPAVLPQVINIFLYGCPSELAGNLTNIDDINANSQNPYTTSRNAGGAGPEILNLANDGMGGQITQHGFWSNAGGVAMEDMITGNGMGGTGNEMLSVYRTINRVKANTRAHRPSVFSSQKGNLDIETSGGVGTTLASVLYENRDTLDGSTLLGGRALSELVMPFVSFEGESTAFAVDARAEAVQLPITMRSISLGTDFDNPYTRGTGVVGTADQTVLDNLVNATSQVKSSRFERVNDSFTNRKLLETKVGSFADGLDDSLLPEVASGDADAVADATSSTGFRLAYPNNSFSQRVRAAVTLAMQNPDSLFITVGGGLGGWDDHDNSIEKYENRMTSLMETLRVAAKHLKLGQRYSDPVSKIPLLQSTDNIIINVHGDFGRNVNLNGSMGWDHGNNQNLYTIGGAAVRGQAALGKVVGHTVRFGDSGQNRQFTGPAADSYQAEPMSIAATVYKYFGVQNPEVLTKDPEEYIQGVDAIDESVAAEPTLF